MSNIAKFAPIRVTVEFSLTDGDQVAKASFDCPPGELPSEADIAAAAASILGQVQSQIGNDFIWQGRHDFVRDELADRTGGMQFSVPGPDEWAAQWTA